MISKGWGSIQEWGSNRANTVGTFNDISSRKQLIKEPATDSEYHKMLLERIAIHR